MEASWCSRKYFNRYCAFDTSYDKTSWRVAFAIYTGG